MSIQRIMASAFTPRRIDVAIHNISAARVCALAFNVRLSGNGSQGLRGRVAAWEGKEARGPFTQCHAS